MMRPNGVRLSCAAVLGVSQMQFYYDGRRQLQPHVRQRSESALALNASLLPSLAEQALCEIDALLGFGQLLLKVLNGTFYFIESLSDLGICQATGPQPSQFYGRDRTDRED